MRKKVVALAVAGVFAAPAVVLAQSSTVQIYGRITYEYGYANQPDPAPGFESPSTDYADSPGGSAIGFRGEEKLGGGLSAWFQCESSADVRGMDQTGLCTRNSAVGFKGGWGNLHFGRWDTPFKRALNMGSVGAEETGILGMSFLPWGGSGGADATSSADSAQRQRWKRREAGLTYYESPKFGGFQILAAFSSGNSGADNAPFTAGQQNQKPRVISLGGTYSAGPLALGIGYEVHQDFGFYAPTAAVTGQSADDKAWALAASYTFAGKIEVGATYLDAKYETNPALGQELKKKTATIGVDWSIAGPHGVEAMYAWADDSSGNATSGIGGNGGSAAPVQAGVCGGALASCATGGDAFSIAYRYRFSKRTRIKLGYVSVSPDANTNTYRIGNVPAGAPGEDSDAFAFHIQHNF
ncbi:MAG TPA: porin [Burkholderiales bacterium]|nr:porin [Burkholderiales bacterium]